MVMAIVAPSKRVNRNALTEFKRFTHEAGRAHTVVQVGAEYPPNALARAFGFETGSVNMRAAPTASSQSHGDVDRLHQTLFAKVGAIRVAFASRLWMGKAEI